MDIVDTHVHLYSEDGTRYPMKKDPLRPPAGTGTLSHLRRVTIHAGVTKIVAIQTGTAYLYDNRFLADTVKANRDWMRGVCTLDPSDTLSPMELTRLVNEYGIRGLRVPFSEAKKAEDLERMWKAASRLGIVVCAHFRGDYYKILANLLEHFPEVPVILDHCAYPSVLEAPEYITIKRLLELHHFRNLYAKLSFVVMASTMPYPCSDAHILVKKLIEGFGAERCMWGSCFPTELWIPKVTYEQHLQIFKKEIGLDEEVKRIILERTPLELWFK
ncbi:amidohydrolase [Candidatus Bathyarchaeota archaeon]|nr:amidohydrolase [Candidatus Bathyarchaeota archaeon]